MPLGRRADRSETPPEPFGSRELHVARVRNGRPHVRLVGIPEEREDLLPTETVPVQRHPRHAGLAGDPLEGRPLPPVALHGSPGSLDDLELERRVVHRLGR